MRFVNLKCNVYSLVKVDEKRSEELSLSKRRAGVIPTMMTTAHIN